MWAGDTVEGSQQAGGRQTDSGPHSYCGVASPSSPGGQLASCSAVLEHEQGAKHGSC